MNIMVLAHWSSHQKDVSWLTDWQQTDRSSQPSA